jgi:hypothetical protein
MVEKIIRSFKREWDQERKLETGANTPEKFMIYAVRSSTLLGTPTIEECAELYKCGIITRCYADSDYPDTEYTIEDFDKFFSAAIKVA